MHWYKCKMNIIYHLIFTDWSAEDLGLSKLEQMNQESIVVLMKRTCARLFPKPKLRQWSLNKYITTAQNVIISNLPSTGIN